MNIDAEKRLNAIADAEAELNLLRRKFLEMCGWKYTCANFSLWLYEKTIDDKKFVVNENTAIWIEECGK